MFAKVQVTVDRAGEGALLLSSAEELGDYPVSVLHSLRRWAAAGPDHPLVAERGPDGTFWGGGDPRRGGAAIVVGGPSAGEAT